LCFTWLFHWAFVNTFLFKIIIFLIEQWALLRQTRHCIDLHKQLHLKSNKKKTRLILQFTSNAVFILCRNSSLYYTIDWIACTQVCFCVNHMFKDSIYLKLKNTISVVLSIRFRGQLLQSRSIGTAKHIVFFFSFWK
jgi:hypothetical protein